jgi:hypothetical protein
MQIVYGELTAILRISISYRGDIEKKKIRRAIGHLESLDITSVMLGTTSTLYYAVRSEKRTKGDRTCGCN